MRGCVVVCVCVCGGGGIAAGWWLAHVTRQRRQDSQCAGREYLYSDEKLEKGKTHDDLWNAAQLEMVSTAPLQCA